MRIPRYHLLTATPAELAEFWVMLAHELRMAGLEALDFSQFAKQCDICSGELLMVLPLLPDKTILDDAIAATSSAWIPQWMLHIDLVTEMAIAMAKHRYEHEGVFQEFIRAVKALPNMPPFQEEEVMQAARARAQSLLEEREWEYGKLWVLRKVLSRELPWILADAPWKKQLDDAMTFLHIWSITWLSEIEPMGNGVVKPPDTSCMPFPVSVLGMGFELTANLEILESFRLNQKKNLEQNMLLLAEMLRGLRFDMSPCELMMRVSAVMQKPLDMEAITRRIRKRRKCIPTQRVETRSTEEISDYEFLTQEEVASLSSPFLPTETDRDVTSYTQEEVDTMVAGLSKEAIQGMAAMIYADRVKHGEQSDFLTQQEAADLLAPVSKQKRKSSKRKREN